MNGPDEKRNIYYAGIPIGGGLGVALGLVLMAVMDNPGFLALGIAIGVSIGTAVSAALAERGK